MPVYRHIAVNEIGDITVVRFLDRAMLDTSNIEEIAEELFALVESVDHRKFLFTFSAQESP